MENLGETIQIGIVVSCVLVMGILTVWAIWFARERNRANAEQAKALGFKLLSRPDKTFRKRIEHLYRISDQVRISNVAMKRRGEEEIYLCDISLSSRNDDSGEMEYRTVCIISPHLDLPYFLLLYQFEQVYALAGKFMTPLLDKIVQSRGLEAIKFENESLFNEKYLLFSNNETKAKNIFSDTLIAKLSNTQNWVIRGEDDMFTFNRFEVRRGKVLTQAEINEQINLALQVFEWMKY